MFPMQTKNLLCQPFDMMSKRIFSLSSFKTVFVYVCIFPCVWVWVIGFCILLTSSRLNFKKKKTCAKIVSFIKLQKWINLTKNYKFCSKDRFVRSFRMNKSKLSVRFSVSKFAIFKVRFFYFCVCIFTFAKKWAISCWCTF